MSLIQISNQNKKGSNILPRIYKLQYPGTNIYFWTRRFFIFFHNQTEKDLLFKDLNFTGIFFTTIL